MTGYRLCMRSSVWGTRAEERVRGGDGIPIRPVWGISFALGRRKESINLDISGIHLGTSRVTDDEDVALPKRFSAFGPCAL